MYLQSRSVCDADGDLEDASVTVGLPWAAAATACSGGCWSGDGLVAAIPHPGFRAAGLAQAAAGWFGSWPASSACLSPAIG